MAAEPTKKKDEGGGLIATLAVVLALSLVGGGGGAYLGYSLAPDPAAPVGKSAAEEGAPAADESPGEEGHGKHQAEEALTGHNAKTEGGHGGGHAGEHQAKALNVAPPPQHARPIDFSVMTVKELPPVVTNLGKPETAWIRLQAAIVFDPKEFTHADKLVPEIMSDITAYLRSLSISGLEGADGLRRLQEELGERVGIRSEHKVREFIIETMVVQ